MLLAVASGDYKTLLDAGRVHPSENDALFGRHEGARRRRVEWIGSAIATWRQQSDELSQDIIGCLTGSLSRFAQTILNGTIASRPSDK